MQEFWVLLLGILFGGLGYLLTTFWFRPILRYRDVKYQIASDLVFYANAIALDVVEEAKATVWNRVASNRRHSADLAAIYLELPAWYKWWLKTCQENPESASSELMGLSKNT
jgi:hypothetical protein